MPRHDVRVGRGTAHIFPRPPEGEAPGSAEAPRFPGRRGRRHLAPVRPALVHRLPQPVPGRVRGTPWTSVRPGRAVPPRTVRRGRERRQNRPALPGARLPHQGAAPGDRALDPALHQTGGPHPGRFLRHWHDRGGGAVVRDSAEPVPRRDRDTVAGAGPAGAGVGSPPHDPGRSVTRRHLHRRQLHDALRRRCLRPGRPSSARRCAGGDRLDV